MIDAFMFMINVYLGGIYSFLATKITGVLHPQSLYKSTYWGLHSFLSVL